VIPLIDVRSGVEELREEIDAAIAQVLDSGSFVLGSQVEAFEREFSAYCGTDHCVGVASGTDALSLSLRALGVGPGDEVIVPAYTAIATWMAVGGIGARPVGVDIDPVTRCLDPERAAEAVTPRTRAIIAVHLFGEVAPMAELTALARQRGIAVVEDCAQAHGALTDGRAVGTFGAAGAFSFYPTKNLGALGDGGAVVTSDAELADRIRLLRTYGWRERDNSLIEGTNSRLDELQAAILRVKLRHLDDWNARRARLAGAYLEGLSGLRGLRLPAARSPAGAAWHLFVVASPDRHHLRAALRDQGIATDVHYDPIPPLAPAYEGVAAAGDHSAAVALSRTAISLPLYPQLTREMQQVVIEAIRTLATRGQRE
jgi:dTDP-3-amino-3,4,6-trideoxy-alpha-D-glucose transaminase